MVVLWGLFYASANAGHDVHPARLLELIKSSSITLFLLYLTTMILGLLFRAWRYRVLLISTGDPNIPSAKEMLMITAVRNMTVDLLPARLGELVFVALLKRQSNTKVSASLSTLLFAMMLDVLILAPFTIAIGLMVGFPTKQPYLLALIALFVGIGFLLGVKFVLPLFSGLFKQWSKSNNKLLASVFGFVASIDDAVQTTLKAGVFAKVIALTIVVRFLKYAGLLCLFYGLTQVNFPDLAQLEELKVLGALIASEMTASLPIPALMSFGTWELGGMTLLAYFGAVPTDALLTMLSLHIQTQALDYGVGIVALVALFVTIKTSGPSRSALTRRAPVVATLFAILALGLSWFGLNESKQQQAAFSAGQAGEVMRPSDMPVPGWLAGLNGYIVWSSNRSGNHDIWRMNLSDLSISPLTTDPHTENFPRVSPDGKKVVFARAHKEWQSVRDDKPWDIWMIDIETGEEQRLAQWGVSPSWSPDGSFVVFQRDPGTIMAVDIRTKKERLYYESGNDPFMKARVNLNTPTIGEGLKMAFTFRNHGQPTNIIRDQYGKFQTVHRDACQVQWAPSGDFTTYVQKGGRQTNQIMRFDPATQQKTTLIDLPGEYSHEYFARMSRDEKWMVFAASTGGHEHDLADYELFLWPVGQAASEAQRLTFQSSNDSWPDLWVE